MRATEFEFRYRFWIITALYAAGFYCYRIDPVNVAWALAVAITGTRGAAAEWDTHLILAGGALLVAAGALLRSWAAAYLRSAVVHDSNTHADRLVSDGPFRYVRNPLYLGMSLMALGIALALSRLGLVVVAGGVAIFGYRLILREEAILLAAQGEGYRRYWETVPRIVPAWRPRVPESGAGANWRDGLVGEGLSWSLAAGMGGLAATERANVFYAALAIGFTLYFLVVRRGSGARSLS